MPPGYGMQPEGVFHEGRASYRFVRVYGATSQATVGSTCPWNPLVESMSFWSSSWAVTDGNGSTTVAGRWLSYARAKESMVPPPSFADFSTMTRMRARMLERLCPPDDDAP